MSLRAQRRLASEIMKIGENRVWIDPARIDDAAMAIRREDVKRLINDGVIRASPKTGVSRGRARILHLKKKKGLRRGPGSRKGSKHSTISKKTTWMLTVRHLRKHSKQLRDRKMINRRTYRMLYGLIKGAFFKSIAQIDSYLDEHKLIKR
ncbi:MAG: 50S ribosomal protein L19e [Candidatus Atabeyarchaeum deiterrae]